MKKQLHLFRSISGKQFFMKVLPHHQKMIVTFFLFLFFQTFFLKSDAQIINDNGQSSTVLANGSYQDFYIPDNPQITKISFYLVGADGGAAVLHMGQYVPFAGFAEIGSYESGGGNGARVSVTFLVGSGTGKIPLGSYIRFVVGKKGQSGSADVNIIPDGGTGAEYGGGGGGTAVLYQPPGGTWTLLAVAGGGGGAYQGVVAGVAVLLGSDGGAGREGESGGDGNGIVIVNSGGGTNGEGGGTGVNGAGGGGALTDGWASNGCIYPWEESNPSVGEGGFGGTTGGYGGTDEGCDNFFDISKGGFGFGGGGMGHISGGGGGGYSGGGAGGTTGAGGGGGSYVNSIWFSRETNSGGHTDNSKDGSVLYNVTLNRPPVAMCKDVTIYLNNSGQATLDPSSVNNESSDPDGDDLTFTLSKNNFSCSDVGTISVTLTVKDSYGATSTCTATATVVDNNAPVVLTKNITAYLDENGQAVITPTQVDNGSSDNCVIQSRGLDITTFSCDDIGPHTVTLTVSDVNGNSASNTAIVTVVDNLGPIITGVTPDQASLWPPDNKIKTVNITIVSTDNCPGNGVSCEVIGISSNEMDNDGEADWEITGDNTVHLRAERWGNGTGRIYTITVECTDGSGNKSTANTTVKVAHNIKAPVTGTPFKVGSTVNLAGEFWDKAGKVHTAKWMIDGTAANGIVSEPSALKNGSVTCSYKFAATGVYKLQMNVTDQTGVTTYANTNGKLDALVVIYDPNGGYTYGGGCYSSPAGALATNRSVKGQVSYGYTINYYKGATKPKGETQFRFGDLEFNAVNFDYLSISGARAQFRGTGKIVGGQSGLGFIMTVMDGALDGNGTDKVRMKIYNKTSGAVIYDNQPGVSDAADPITAIGANSSVVIKGTAVTTAAKPSEQITQLSIEGLQLIAHPNPARKNFTIQIKSSNKKDQLLLQVFDAFGRSVEVRNNIAAGLTILLGDAYRPGAYYIRVSQGTEQKELKLIKVAD